MSCLNDSVEKNTKIKTGLIPTAPNDAALGSLEEGILKSVMEIFFSNFSNNFHI